MRALIFFLFFIIASLSQAQNANIRGFVYETENGEPVIFTNVYLQGTTHGATSDVNGYYSITKIPVGNYTLMVSYLGYDTLKMAISVKDAEIITKKLFLKKSALQLKTIDISAETQQKQTEVKISVNSITPREIKQMPTVGGEPDLAQYLQVLPGVVFTGDQGGQLYIRGGSPVQNKVLLDGMIIYNPFHSIGLFSVFDADIIRNADIYTGGFNAEYGGRISSIMDITTRDGNKKNIGGKVALSTFGAKTLIDGPLKRQTDPEKGSSSFILSIKNSYLEQSSKIFYPYVNSAGLPFDFTDLYGKVSFNSPNGSKLNIFGFNFNDQVKYQALSSLGWNSTGVGSNFVLVPPGSPILVEGNFAYSSYSVGIKEEIIKPRQSDINGFNMGLNFTYFIKKNELKYGIEVLGFHTSFDFFNSSNREIQQEENTTELAGYIKYKIINKNQKLVVEPSFRAHYYASLSNFSPEPRLGAKYNLTSKLRFKFAGGFYSQNLISASSDRDVVNLFYGFLSGPDNLPETFTNKDNSVTNITQKLQKANHIIVGTEYELFKHVDINLEIYRKNFTQLTNINRNKLYDDNEANSAIADILKKDYIIETGNAQGIDLSVKYDYKRLYIWLVYSLGFVTRFDGIQEYVPHFDRRHNINFVSSYTFGKNHNWEADARWNFGSGFPFTQTQGYYENLNFADGINTDYTTKNGVLTPIYGPLNTGRLPYYHRLDVSVKRKFVFTESTTLEASAGATNVYNRENIFYFDRLQYKRVNQLPIMPSISMSLTF